jgi:hypothetical protein
MPFLDDQQWKPLPKLHEQIQEHIFHPNLPTSLQVKNVNG